MASGADLLESIRRSPYGRKRSELKRLLKHYEFAVEEGGSHTIYRHELLPPGMVVVVPRHRAVKPYVARRAVAAVDLVLASEQETDNG